MLCIGTERVGDLLSFQLFDILYIGICTYQHCEGTLACGDAGNDLNILPGGSCNDRRKVCHKSHVAFTGCHRLIYKRAGRELCPGVVGSDCLKFLIKISKLVRRVYRGIQRISLCRYTDLLITVCRKSCSGSQYRNPNCC